MVDAIVGRLVDGPSVGLALADVVGIGVGVVGRVTGDVSIVEGLTAQIDNSRAQAVPRR